MGRPPLCCICGNPIKGEEPVIISITGSFLNGKKCHLDCYNKNLNNLSSIEKQLKEEQRKRLRLYQQKYNKKKKEKSSSKNKKEKKLKNEKKQKMSEKEKLELDEVYKYIQNILDYDHPLSPNQVRIIQNLRFGQIIRRGTVIIGNEHGYPYPVILLTLKAKKETIDYVLKTKNFKDENSKLSYIMAIVSNNINDIYTRWKRIESQKMNLKNFDDDIYEDNGKEYQAKENKYLNNELFEDLW